MMNEKEQEGKEEEEGQEEGKEIEYARSRVALAQTNCFGFALQMLNSLSWEFKHRPLFSFKQVKHEMMNAYHNKNKQPYFLMVTMRLQTKPCAGHSFALEFRPEFRNWYIFQAFQGLSAPMCSRLERRDVYALFDELDDSRFERLLLLANLTSDISQTKLKTNWKFMWCEPKHNDIHKADDHVQQRNRRRQRQRALFRRNYWWYSILLSIVCVCCWRWFINGSHVKLKREKDGKKRIFRFFISCLRRWIL